MPSRLESLSQPLAILLILSLGLCDASLIFASIGQLRSTIIIIILSIYHLAVVIAAITSPLLGETFKSLRTRRAHSALALALASIFTLLSVGLQFWVTVDLDGALLLLAHLGELVVKLVTMMLPIAFQLVAVAHIAWGCSEVEIREGAIQLREDTQIPDTEAQASDLPSKPSDTIAPDPNRPVSIRFLLFSLLTSLMIANIAIENQNDPLSFIISLIIIIHHLILFLSSIDRVHFDSDSGTGAGTRTAFLFPESVSHRLRSTLSRQILVGSIPTLAGLSVFCALFTFSWGYMRTLTVLQTIEGIGLMVCGVISWNRLKRGETGPVVLEEEERLHASDQ